MFTMIPLQHTLRVDGHSDAEAVGAFSGVVLAVGLRASDPVGATSPETPRLREGNQVAELEGLLAIACINWRSR